jgi:CheY-like chemotaxis protein
VNETKIKRVLLIEDDPADQKLVKNALSAIETRCEIHIEDTAENALEYLRQIDEGNMPDRYPNIILLDLNMPGMGGIEFLRQIKSDDKLYTIPVVILTTSDSPTDVEQCYKLQASGYIQKSATSEEFEAVVQKFAKYWFVTSILKNQ